MKVEEPKLIVSTEADMALVRVGVVSIEAVSNFSLLGSPRGFGGFGVDVCVRQCVNRKFEYPHMRTLVHLNIRLQMTDNSSRYGIGSEPIHG